jgi:DNA-binding response OmpR family regulator
VDVLGDGTDGLTAALAVLYDLLIVDVLLPGTDGCAICRDLRARHIATPLLLLTALGEVEQRITGS